MFPQIAVQAPVLLVTKPGRISDGLRTLLRIIPGVGTIYQATDGPAASQIIAENHPALVLLESKLFDNDMERIATQIKTTPFETRYILMVDHLREKSMADITGADTVLLSGFSAEEFLVTVEKLLPQKTVVANY
jgi:DNA-binding response OmpR family regulator